MTDGDSESGDSSSAGTRRRQEEKTFLSQAHFAQPTTNAARAEFTAETELSGALHVCTLQYSVLRAHSTRPVARNKHRESNRFFFFFFFFSSPFPSAPFSLRRGLTLHLCTIECFTSCMQAGHGRASGIDRLT